MHDSACCTELLLEAKPCTDHTSWPPRVTAAAAFAQHNGRRRRCDALHHMQTLPHVTGLPLIRAMAHAHVRMYTSMRKFKVNHMHEALRGQGGGGGALVASRHSIPQQRRGAQSQAKMCTDMGMAARQWRGGRRCVHSGKQKARPAQQCHVGRWARGISS
jgi:hypothetical protein